MPSTSRRKAERAPDAARPASGDNATGHGAGAAGVRLWRAGGRVFARAGTGVRAWVCLRQCRGARARLVRGVLAVGGASMKDTSLHEIDPRVVVQFQAAAKLGEMSASGALSREDAQMAMEFVFAEAAHRAPKTDARGLRARLAWHMADSASASLLARTRALRAQERALADIAERGFAGGQSEREVARNMLAAAAKMSPLPTDDIAFAALKLGQWRARHLSNGR